MRAIVLAVLLLVPFACADDPEPAKVCAPGKQEACACPGGGQGAQVCNEEGSGFGACSPCAVGAGGSGGSAGAAGAADWPGPGCVYEKVKQQACSLNPTPNKPDAYTGCMGVPDVCVASKSPEHAPFNIVCCPAR